MTDFSPWVWLSRAGKYMHHPLPLESITGCVGFYNESCMPTRNMSSGMHTMPICYGNHYSVKDPRCFSIFRVHQLRATSYGATIKRAFSQGENVMQ